MDQDSYRISNRSASDARVLLRAAVSDLVTAGLAAFSEWLEERPEANPFVDDGNSCVNEQSDDAAAQAAALLGVSVDATTDDVRTAFRAKVKRRVATGAFHDQRGGETDEDAQLLIAAKNLLIERGKDSSDAA